MLRHETLRIAPKFSKELSANDLEIDMEGPTITGKDGYLSCIALSTRPLPSFYFEATIVNDSGYARVGMATKDYEKYGPIGIDNHGYSYGNKNGYGFHNSIRIRFGERFSKNDIISVYLYKEKKKRVIEFFINGRRQYNKFKVPDNVDLWPAISVYNGCQVQCNFGPFFVYVDAVKLRIEEAGREQKS